MVEGEGLEPEEQRGEAWGQDKILGRQVKQICLVAVLTLPIQNLVGPRTTDILENLLRQIKYLWYDW